MKPQTVLTILAMTVATTAFAADNQLGAFDSQIQYQNTDFLMTRSLGISHTLRGHIPQIVRSMTDKGGTSADQKISVSIVMQLNDEANLDQAIDAIYKVGSPTYHQFLSTKDFVAKYAPTNAQIAAEKTMLQSKGITVTDVTQNNMIIHATGTTAAFNAAFATEIHNFQGNDGQVYFAPAYDLQAPVESRIAAVVGLNNTAHIRNYLKIADVSPKAGTTSEGSAPKGGLAPADIIAAYHIPTGLNGKGQTLAVFELDGFKQANIQAYATQFKLPNTPINVISIDGASSAPDTTGGEAEVELDIELMMGIAPQATAINVYEGPNSSAGLIDTYSKIAQDNTAKQISTSWGEPEVEAAASDMQSENTIFKQMVAQGQSLFSAAGDSGATDDSAQPTDAANKTKALVDDPSAQPYVVAVGGTKMTIGTSAAWASETTWNELSPISLLSEGAGGGGVSTIWSIPSWQTNAKTADTQFSSTMRNTPDVSLNADPKTGYGVYVTTPIYKTYMTTGWMPIGGTSAAAPLWAAFNALVNQNRVAKGLTTTGFLNPMLYAIGTGSNASKDFHDIADGSSNGTSTAGFNAVSGYDNATGWGSFQGTNLLNDLSK